MYPALVVHQALGKHADPVLWVGSEGGMEGELVQRAGLPYTTIPAGQIAGMGLKTLPNLVKVAQGTLASRRILQRFKPDVVLFTGGFVAVPMALAARNVPSLVYVPDIEPGLALKLISRFASVVALTVEDARAYFPASTRTVVTGYPLRPNLTEWTRMRGQAHLNLRPERFTLLVTGGSKGARSLNQAFLAIVPELLKEMQVVHITGQADWQEIEAFRAGLPSELAADYHIMPYLHEMGAALASADLVVSRAGASVLGEYPFFGLPAILVPYPYAWRYQKVNADYLVRRDAALLIETARLPEQLLPAIQSLSRDPQRLQAMRTAMQAAGPSRGQPQAAQRLAELALELAQSANQKAHKAPA